MQMIPSPWLGFFRGVFLANHLASNDNLTKTTNTHEQIVEYNNTKKKPY